jgi:hypothetical protein
MNMIKVDFSSIRSKDVGIALILDIVALTFVLFIPKIARLVHFPVYMIEPMRLMVILSFAHSSRVNSYLLAFTLPLFSWAVSGHPEFFKMLVMICEIGTNVFLFYHLLRKTDSVFLSMIISIVSSKILCYALYLVFFSMMFLKEEAEPSFLVAQLFTTLAFSAYVFLILRKKSQ